MRDDVIRMGIFGVDVKERATLFLIVWLRPSRRQAPMAIESSLCAMMVSMSKWRGRSKGLIWVERGGAEAAERNRERSNRYLSQYEGE